MKAEVNLPAKLVELFSKPARFRGAYGGRGSGKSASFGTMAAIYALKHAQAGREGLIVCAREYMNSLADSSFAEIKAAIDRTPWLKPFFDIGERYIRTACGRVSFAFIGLKQNIDSIKSKSRILVLWVEEAENVSQSAWDKAIPTVREPGSEIWATWNPERDGSPTDKLFRKQPYDGTEVVEINWRDNPWFPEELKSVLKRDAERDPDRYAHVWEGQYLSLSEAAVFRRWSIRDFVTPDVERFYFGADWGFSVDPTALVRCFIQEETLFIDYEAVKVGCEIDKTPELFRTVPESEEWPIIADSARPETISYMKRAGFDMFSSKKGAGSVEEGIKFLQGYDIVVHPRCKHTITELQSYKYKIDSQTQEVLPVLADKDNHVIDALRYALENKMRSERKQKITPVVAKLDIGRSWTEI